MEILLNELSIHNQFESFHHFQNTALPEILNFFNLQKTGSTTVLKKSDIYSREVYNNVTLHEILISKNIEGKSDEIKKLKSQLLKIIDDPYWDNQKLCVQTSNYTYCNGSVNDTSLAEGYERNSKIISLTPSSFMLANLIIFKDKVDKTLINYFSFKSLIERQYNEGSISFQDFCRYFFNNSKIDFSKINLNESFNYITRKIDEELFLSSFKMFNEMNWDNILKQGGKGKNKVGLAYSKYHNQAHFASYNTKNNIYKFRVTQRYRVFGFRECDTFYILEFDLTHRLSD